MILPAESEALRDLRDGMADTLTRVIGPRALQLANQPAAESFDAATVLAEWLAPPHALRRGQVLHLEAFGQYTSDIGGGFVNPVYQIVVGGDVLVELIMTEPDQAGSVQAFHARAVLRVSGGVGGDLNTPPTPSDIAIDGILRVDISDTTRTTNTYGQLIGLAGIGVSEDPIALSNTRPIRIQLLVTPDPVPTQLWQVIAGTVQGL